MSEWKVAVVTGGERGIGRAITDRLIEEGWTVVVAGIDDEAAFYLERDYSENPKLRFSHCDISDERSVDQLMRTVGSDLGRLDGLVLNAAIASPDRTPLEEIKLSDWQRVIDVNLTGAFLCAKHACHLLKSSKGSVVAIASTRATMSEANTFAYSASKGGLVSLVHSFASSIGPDVRVNAISPGWIHTGDFSELSARDHSQHLVGRVGHPADVAGLVNYLLGPESGFVTAQNFVIDGGMVRKMIYH